MHFSGNRFWLFVVVGIRNLCPVRYRSTVLWLSHTFNVYLKHPAVHLQVSLDWEISEGDPTILCMSAFKHECKQTSLELVLFG